MRSSRTTTPEIGLQVEALPAPVPVFTGSQMRQAFTAYQDLQRTLDASMPDQIITIDGRAFRKKGYWRAIAVAFNLTVEPTDERRAVQGSFDDGQDNFGYIVTYRATTPSGRSASGDGACFAIEKAPRAQANRWQTVPKQASEHNVRSHACTRAFNRAVSNLVGFGEVSAEEIERDDDTPPSRVRPATPRPPTNAARETTPTSPAGDDPFIDHETQRHLFRLSDKARMTREQFRVWLAGRGVTETARIRKSELGAIVSALFTEPSPPSDTSTREPGEEG